MGSSFVKRLMVWLWGAIGAAFSGISTTLLTVGAGRTFGAADFTWRQIGSIALSAAVIGVLMYFAKSPLPKLDEEAVVAIAACLLAVAAFTTFSLNAQTLDADKRLVIAQTHDAAQTYRTDLVAAWLALSDPVPHSPLVFASDCILGAVEVPIVYGGTAQLTDAGYWQCAIPPRDFYTMASPSPLVRSVIRYSHAGVRNSLVVPPVGAISEGVTQLFGPIRNDADFHTTVTVFPSVPSTRLLLDVHDAAGKLLKTEVCDVVLPVSQCTVATTVHTGSLGVSVLAFNGHTPPVYGFVDVSSGYGAGSVLPFP